MGLAYQAVDTSTPGTPEVVLKCINLAPPGRRRGGRSASSWAMILARFGREAEALVKLDKRPHPNIVRYIAWHNGATGTRFPYLVMEKVPGPNLHEEIERRRGTDPWRADEVLAVARQVAAALARCHEEPLFHRDIKPANIVVRGPDLVAGNPAAPTGELPAPEFVLIDFGLACDPALAPMSGIQVVGTKLYMAPEYQANGRKGLSAACDVFALGVVLAELCFGWPCDANGIPTGRRYRDPRYLPSTPDVLGELPGWFLPLVRRMLLPEPKLRPTAAEVFRRVDDVTPRVPSAVDAITTRLTPEERNKYAGLATRAVTVGADGTADGLIQFLTQHQDFAAASGQVVGVLLGGFVAAEFDTALQVMGQALRQAGERADELTGTATPATPLDPGGVWSRWVSAISAWFGGGAGDADPVRPLAEELDAAAERFNQLCRACERVAQPWPGFAAQLKPVKEALHSVVKAVRAVSADGEVSDRLRGAVDRGKDKLKQIRPNRSDLTPLREAEAAELLRTLNRSAVIHVA